MDISGPFPDIGYSGQRYWISIIDDFTDYAWVTCVNQRSDLTQAFKAFLEREERPERRCHFVRVDQGGENQDSDLAEYCLDRGIKLDWAGTDEHEQNGIAEALNRVILQRVTPLIISAANIAPKFWPYFVETSIYLRNRHPSRRLKMTPYEAYLGQKPELDHIRKIGTEGFALLPKGKQRKLRDKTFKVRLLGYQHATNYIVIDEKDNIRILKNIVFRESRKRSCSDCNQEEDDHEAESQPICKGPRIDGTTAKQQKPDNVWAHPMSAPLGDNPAQDHSSTMDNPTHGTDEADSMTVSNSGTRNESPEEHNSITVTLPEPSEDTTPPSPEQETLPEPGGRNHATLQPRSTRGMLPKRFLLPAIENNPKREATVALFLLFSAAQSQQDTGEPRTVNEAIAIPEWWDSMSDEHASLKENDSFELVHLPANRSALTGKWVYKSKTGAGGELARRKSRYVVRGFEQKEGIDYDETFAAVVKPMSYKMLFALAAALDLDIEQMDVKTAFLYGEIDGEVYVRQPQGFDDGSGRVWRLKKALYGLKQAPRIWYQTLTDFLKDLGFEALDADHGVFARGNVYIAIYVDDLLIAGKDKQEIADIKARLSDRFRMADLGPCHFYLGMTIQRNRSKKSLSLSQSPYIKKVIYEAGMENCAPVSTPIAVSTLEPAPKDYKASDDDRHWFAKVIGSLMYIMLGTRPDIAFAISLCCRFMANPTAAHITALKRVLRYLKGTITLVLTYRGDLKPLAGYSDSDWAGDVQTRRSTAGYIFNLGSGAISWQSKRQPTVALSSCEAEYMGQTAATKEAIWLRALLTGMTGSDIETTVLFGDNQGAIALSRNPEFHARTKHIDTQYHFTREKVESGEVKWEYLPTRQQIADGLTKPLPRNAFEDFRKKLGLEQPEEEPVGTLAALAELPSIILGS